MSASVGVRPSTWAAVALIAGGALNVVVWPVYTDLHGPTSFNRDDELLGLDALDWGAVMEGPSGLLVALGLAGSYAFLTARGGWLARWGFALAMIALILTSAATIVVRAPVPPLLAPVLGLGLVLIGTARRRAHARPRRDSSLLLALGATQIFAFGWAVAVRPDLMDRIDGYRIYGLVASVLYGALWVALGSSLLAQRRDGASGTASPTARP